MPLSKKYYIILAEALGHPNVKTKGQIIKEISSVLKEDNPRFDAKKFAQAIAQSHYMLSTERGDYGSRYKKVTIGKRTFQLK